jgi:BR serine/threonine kinase
MKHPWVVAGGKTNGELDTETVPMMAAVPTHIIPSEEAIDPDILSQMTSLGCFKDKAKLISNLLNSV